MARNRVFGTDASQLHRPGAPVTSVMAAAAVDTKQRERAVLEIIGRFRDGVISDRVRECFPSMTPYSSVTARYRALERKGLIVRGPDTRPGKSGVGQLVMRITWAGRLALEAE